MGESTGRLAPAGRDGSAGVLVKVLSQQVSGLLRDEMQPGCPGQLASLLVHRSPAAEPGLWAVSWCRPAVLRQLRQGHRPRGWRPGQGRSAAVLPDRPACPPPCEARALPRPGPPRSRTTEAGPGQMTERRAGPLPGGRRLDEEGRVMADTGKQGSTGQRAAARGPARRWARR